MSTQSVSLIHCVEVDEVVPRPPVSKGHEHPGPGENTHTQNTYLTHYPHTQNQLGTYGYINNISPLRTE